MDNAVLLLRGTGGNARSLLNPVFSDVLLVPGQPARYRRNTSSSCPTRSATGRVRSPPTGCTCTSLLTTTTTWCAPDRLMLDEMKIDHLRLILGTSMGCIRRGSCGVRPTQGRMDALAPFACLPVRDRETQSHDAVHGHPRTSSSTLHGKAASTRPSRRMACAAANQLLLVMGSSAAGDAEARRPHAKQAEEFADRYLARDHGEHRCERHDLLHERQPQLQPRRAKLGDDQGAGAVDQFRRRLHQPAGAGHCRERSEKRFRAASSFCCPSATRRAGTEPTLRLRCGRITWQVPAPDGSQNSAHKNTVPDWPW